MRSHAHGVDHCGTSWSVHNNQLKKPSSCVRSQHEVPVRIFIDLLDHECVSKGVLNVLARDPVTEGRWQFIHLSIVLRNLPGRTLRAPQAGVRGDLGRRYYAHTGAGWGFTSLQVARRRTSHRVTAMSSTDNPNSQPASIHWNAQNRVAGW